MAEDRLSTYCIFFSFVFVVLTAGCMTGPDPGGPTSGYIEANEVNATPTNATVVPYSEVEIEKVRVVVVNASEDPYGYGEADFTESDWRKFERSELGGQLVENGIYVRYQDRLFRVVTVSGG